VNAHRKRRGEAAIAIAVVLWVIAGIVLFVERRQLAGAAKAAAGPASAGSPSDTSQAASNATPGAPGSEAP